MRWAAEHHAAWRGWSGDIEDAACRSGEGVSVDGDIERRAGPAVQVVLAHVPEAEACQVVLNFAHAAVGVAACDGGLPGNDLTRGFGIASGVVVRVEAGC